MNALNFFKGRSGGFSRLLAMAAGLSLAASQSQAAVNVTMFHNHLSRDGIYIDPAFTPANASNLVRDLSFNGAVQGEVYAQPVYVEGGPRGRAVVIVCTESNTVYALDATTGNIVWETNVAPNVQSSALPCGNISPWGITGTPAVDLASRSIFFDALTEQPFGPVLHEVFSLNVDTGAVNPGWPLVVDSNAPPSSGNHFSSLAQGERGALLIVGTNLYVPFGGLAGDCPTYFGWVIGMPLVNPSNHVVSWATSAQKGGIWAIGGPASDGVDVYAATGNTTGTVGTNWGGGEAILHLPPNLSETNNFWAATNWPTLDQKDLDIGGSGPLLVTVPGATPSNLVVALGKDGNMYLLNRTTLGGIHAAVNQANVAGGSSIIQAAVTYQTSLGTYVTFQNGGNLHAIKIGAANPPTITSVWTQSAGGSCSPFVTSTDGTNNMIVWGYGTEGDQKLHAYNGDTGATIFSGGTANEVMANTHHFSTAMVARGRIYVGSDNLIYAFEAGPQVTSISVTKTNIMMLPGNAFQFSFTNVPGALFNVFATTDLSQPFTNWTWLGSPNEVSPGQFQFTDSTNSTARFYSVVSP